MNSKLALGTVQFGMLYGVANHSGQVKLPEAKAMLDLARSKGIDTLDTAIAYGNSENLLGQIGTGNFKLVTKLPRLPPSVEDVKKWVHQELDASLARLGLNRVYALLLHRPEELLNKDGSAIYRALLELKDMGRVQKIGISIYSPHELESLTAKFNFDLVQAPFNLIDQRLFSSGWLQWLKDSDVEVHTRSAFLQGLLLMSQADIPSKFSPWNPLWKNWHSWLAENNASAVQTSLAFALSFPEIDRVVVGADSQSQLLEIINSEKNLLQNDMPNLSCADEKLINPANWSDL